MSACPPAAPAVADDGSDGNESLSAPSEFLAEFLSAIMRRQYAEALKYCRLILQYEPHNATARGFYPLLRHKLTNKHPPPEGEAEHTEHSAGEHDNEQLHVPSNSEAMDHSADVSVEDEVEDEGEDGSEYASSPSSLELDSEPETDTRDHTDSTGSGPGSRWDSSGSSPRDDNGNNQTGVCPGGDTSDVENDNAPHLDNESVKPDLSSETESWASLRRLRARFAAIK